MKYCQIHNSPTHGLVLNDLLHRPNFASRVRIFLYSDFCRLNVSFRSAIIISNNRPTHQSTTKLKGLDLEKQHSALVSHHATERLDFCHACIVGFIVVF
jgi:hypothetical protein